jgi:hypothetical protein
MPAPNVEPVLEENPELEPGLFDAKLTTVEVAKHLRGSSIDGLQDGQARRTAGF